MRAVFGCACDRCAPTEKPIRRIVNKPGCNLFIAANDAVYDVVAVVSPLKPLTLCSDRNRRPSAVSACTHSSTSSANMALVCERMCVCGLYPPTHGKSFHFVRLQSNEQTHNSRLAHTNNTHTHKYAADLGYTCGKAAIRSPAFRIHVNLTRGGSASARACVCEWAPTVRCVLISHVCSSMSARIRYAIYI